MKRFMRSKRGVSTVISTILMIMVAMIGMSVLFGYVVFYTDNYKAGAGSSVLEHLTVEDIWVTGSSGRTLEITVYNPSTKVNQGTDIDLTVATMYYDGQAFTNNDQTSTNKNTINFNEVTIEPNGHYTFKCLSNKDLTNGFNLKIVTTRSSSFEVHYTKP